MAKLYEHLTEEQLKVLVPDLDERLLDLAVQNESLKTFVTPDDTEVGVQLLKVTHGLMWQRAQRVKGKGRWIGYFPGNLTDVLRQELSTMGAISKDRFNVMVGKVGQKLQSNGLAQKVGKGKTPGWMLAEWHEPKWVGGNRKPTRAEVIHIDQQLKRAEEENAKHPVHTEFDLRSIPKPQDLTPEAFHAYLVRITKAMQTANERIVELEAALSEAAKQDWGKELDAIDDVINGA